MNRNKAKLKFNPNNFEIIEEGDHVADRQRFIEKRMAAPFHPVQCKVKIG